jgi:hypothetical protein
MKFIKFTIIYLLFTIGYLAYLLSKLEPLHVHEIALTFIAIGSMLAGGVSLLGSLKEEKSDIVESNDDTSI